MNLIDSIELDILEQTGDIDQAEKVGFAVRFTCDTIIDMIAAIGGFGPSFTADMAAAFFDAP